MHWNGLYLVAMGVFVGGYGWWAASSPKELKRNRRSANLIPNLASRLPGGSRAFLLLYLLIGAVFLFAGVHYVITGHSF